MSAGIRAIVDINQTAARFKSSIVLRINDAKFVDAKSILGLSLTLYQTDEYRLEIHGPDEVEAKSAMLEVFNKHHLHVEVN
ncbi:HPr family phosphocarrier protein [Paenibacillus abyssi]|uniref:HPr domain-containing protein n=1 Tax=Paenibacillus abyssi TaxID=1340531 RepID=A0A917FMU3_9BACL|nr:HPr family phosphocarrier protein [Paenibacillus abyssi]GGF93264.1 hypothetical protein GCM10010916_08280 [Paenibacillus abyssi]